MAGVHRQGSANKEAADAFGRSMCPSNVRQFINKCSPRLRTFRTFPGVGFDDDNGPVARRITDTDQRRTVDTRMLVKNCLTRNREHRTER